MTSIGARRAGGRHVVMLLENNGYPRDVRPRREAESLVAAGYQVTIIAPREPGEPAREDVGGVRVWRFRLPQATAGAARDRRRVPGRQSATHDPGARHAGTRRRRASSAQPAGYAVPARVAGPGTRAPGGLRPARPRAGAVHREVRRRPRRPGAAGAGATVAARRRSRPHRQPVAQGSRGAARRHRSRPDRGLAQRPPARSDRAGHAAAARPPRRARARLPRQHGVPGRR